MKREPVSDEFLRQLRNHANSLMDGVAFGVADAGILGAMISVAVDELFARRAADLAAEDRVALRWTRRLVLEWRNPFNPDLTVGSMKSAALAVLDRLLSASKDTP